MSAGDGDSRLDEDDPSAWIADIAARRSRESFALLFSRFAPRVKSYLLKLGARPELAEELAQETLLTVWRKAAYFDPNRAGAATWIFTIARNLRIDALRRERHPEAFENAPELAPAEEQPADAIVVALQRLNRVREALGALSADQVEVVRLSFFEEKPHSEISEDLGLPLGTVKSRLRLAMARLRTRLEDLVSSPVHHPSETVLADYASGALADGPSLAVSAHLELCACCRKATRLFEAVGGELLQGLDPAQMQADALDQALARIERPPPASQPPVHHPGPEGLVLPRALAARGIGRRRFVGPGFWIAPVPSRGADGWRTYLLRAPSGTAVPHHGHNGAEYTVVLRGAFFDDGGHFAVGDFAECDEDGDHQPEAEGPSSCICLITGQGGLRAKGILRLLQPFLGV